MAALRRVIYSDKANIIDFWLSGQEEAKWTVAY